MLNQTMLAGLVADGSEQVLGRPALHYESRNPEVALAVSWLRDEQLPALITRREHGHTVITRLLALYQLPQSPWPYRRVAGYRYTDFADIGDQEHDFLGGQTLSAPPSDWICET